MTNSAALTRRLDRIEDTIEHLELLAQRTADELEEDPVQRAALERFLEVGVQSMIDVGSRLIAERRWQGVDTYAEVFSRLSAEEVLTPDHAQRLVQATGLRNRLVHEYLTVDVEVLLASLPGAIRDMKGFVVAVYRELDG